MVDGQLSIRIGFCYHRLTTVFDAYYLMTHHSPPYVLPPISVALYLSYVYIEALEPALINRVLILDLRTDFRSTAAEAAVEGRKSIDAAGR